jgi:AraC family transcriptional regulator
MSIRHTANRQPPTDSIIPLSGDGFILTATSPYHHWSGSGKLSIKTFSSGPVYYELGSHRYAVDEQSYFILNDGQDYTIHLDAPFPISSFCVFFPDHIADEVRRSFLHPASALLDSPAAALPTPTEFTVRTHPHDPTFSSTLSRLQRDLPHHLNDTLWLDEQLHHLTACLLQVQAKIQREVQAITAVRASTREELYHRLHLARDFIYASFTAPLTLADIANAVYLSPNHLLRTFKQYFHQSPHQFLIECRLKHACRLLTRTDLRVTDICVAVGFQSLGSFSWLFRQRFGLTPIQYRQQKGDFREVTHADLVHN